MTEKNEYTGVHMHVYYICAKHGLQHQSIDNMLHGHKCIRCSYEERGLNCRHSSEYIKSVIDSKNNNVLLNPEDYTGVFDKNLKIKCGECGNVYITNFDSYVSKNQIRCKHCSQSESNGEFIIRKFLEDNDVKFEQEKIFNDCKDNSYLPFDFYLPEYNLIIEFDGQHHFHKNVFDNFESTKIHDEIKNNYCSDNGIDILRIPYWEGNNIGNILKDKLCL